MVDVIGIRPEAMRKYIEFVTKISDVPIIDSPSPDVKISALKHAAEIGLLDKVVYNSID